MSISTIARVAGLDIGYGNVKGACCELKSSISSEFLLPSGAAPLSSMPKKGLSPDLKGGEAVVVNGVDWAACVEQHHIQGGVRQTHSEFIGTPEYQAMLLGALSRFDVPRISRLVTGLPVSQYYGNGNHELIAKIKSVMTGTHQINTMKSVRVDAVQVVSQPFGAFMGLAALPEYSYLATKRDISILVIDAGFYSVDWVIISEGSVLDQHSQSSQLATSHILDLTAKSLSEEYGRMVSRDRLDMLLRNRERVIELGGKEVDFVPRLHDTADGIADRVCTDIMGTLRNFKSSIDYIIVTGGGGYLYEAEIARKFPTAKIITQAEPVLGNVRGYLAIAKRFEAKERSIGAAA